MQVLNRYDDLMRSLTTLKWVTPISFSTTASISVHPRWLILVGCRSVSHSPARCDLVTRKSIKEWHKLGLGSSLTFSLVNSLRPSDAIWRQWSWTTLAQVMACCLTAPSHYLNQCWLIIRGVLWHTSESSFAGIAQGIDSGYEFEKDILKNIFKSPRGQWVKTVDGAIPSTSLIVCTSSAKTHWCSMNKPVVINHRQHLKGNIHNVLLMTMVWVKYIQFSVGAMAWYYLNG